MYTERGVPCIDYAGDFDPNNPNANGLTDEMDLIVPSAQIYSPFTVNLPVSISSLSINTLSTVGVIDPATCPWSISTGVSSGNAGKVVASGTSPCSYKLTGRSGFGLTEWNVGVSFPDVTLMPGITYYENVTPQCTNVNDSNCPNARYFESDEEDVPPLNHHGEANVLDDSFVNSSFFGFDYTPTWGGSGACGGIGCDDFSAVASGSKSN